MALCCIVSGEWLMCAGSATSHTCI
jgi:hypothetical protein